MMVHRLARAVDRRVSLAGPCVSSLSDGPVSLDRTTVNVLCVARRDGVAWHPRRRCSTTHGCMEMQPYSKLPDCDESAKSIQDAIEPVLPQPGRKRAVSAMLATGFVAGCALLLIGGHAAWTATRPTLGLPPRVPSRVKAAFVIMVDVRLAWTMLS